MTPTESAFQRDDTKLPEASTTSTKE